MSFVDFDKLKLDNIDPERAKRVEKAKKDFWFFCSYYLSHKFYDEPAEFQKIVFDIFTKRALTEEHIKKLKPLIKAEYHKYLKPSKLLQGLVNCWPREHAKTTFAEAFLLWNAIFFKEPFQVILSASEKSAETILENIKAEIEENLLIYEDFGDLKTDRWRKDEIRLKNGAVIISKGFGSTIRGMRKRQYRPSLILLDDVMKDDAAYSPTQREKIYRRFKMSILPLGRDAFIIVTNTILHNDDLPSRLLKEIEEGKLLDWAGLRFSAITPSGEPLWPAHWPLEKLERKKLELGSAHFATEYLNEPLSDEDRLFREEWINYYRDSELPPLDELQISVGVDPATGKQQGDFSAIVVTGKDKRGVIYVLYTYIKKVSPVALMEELFRVYQQFRPKVIVFEEVAFQEVYKKWILEEGSKRGIHLPVRGVKPRGSKEVRAMSLAPLMENGLLKFKENQKELIEQLLTFPKGAHDDAVDALVYSIQGLEAKNSKPQILKTDIIAKWLQPLLGED